MNNSTIFNNNNNNDNYNNNNNNNVIKVRSYCCMNRYSIETQQVYKSRDSFLHDFQTC